MTTHRNILYILYIAHRKNIYGGGLALLVGAGSLNLLPGLARLTESPGLTTFFPPRNPESDICVQVFKGTSTLKSTVLLS